MHNHCIATYKSDDSVMHAELEINHIGTPNVSHKAGLKARWGNVYAGDWNLIESLLKYKNIKANFRSYIFCHVPGKFDL